LQFLSSTLKSALAFTSQELIVAMGNARQFHRNKLAALQRQIKTNHMINTLAAPVEEQFMTSLSSVNGQRLHILGTSQDEWLAGRV